MRLSLHEVLAIVGRLDDAPGFDTPRERFRRFLVEHMTSVAVARTFLDEAQQLITEQYQRALQDTLLAAGTLLGFEVRFAAYERQGSAARTAGEWLSRRRLSVTVQLWSDDAAMDPGAVTRALDAPLLGDDQSTPRARLCVLSPACGSRPRVEEGVFLRRHQTTRIVALRSLMDMISVAGSGHLTHDDVLRLLNPAAALEGAIGLIARLAHPPREEASRTTVGASPTSRERACWVYVVREHEPGNLEPAGVRETIRMTLPVGEHPPLATNDLIAFLVPSRGVVAQAEVGEVTNAEDARLDESQMLVLIHVRKIVILDPPAPVDTEQRLNLELQAAVSQEPCVRVSREEFEAMTLPGPASTEPMRPEPMRSAVVASEPARGESTEGTTSGDATVPAPAGEPAGGL